MKDKLDTINSVQGASLKELENQLEESRKIYENMEDSLQGEILQNLISVILACDQDGDMTLSDAEIDDIVARLEKLEGVDLKEDLIRSKIIEHGRSMNGMLLKPCMDFSSFVVSKPFFLLVSSQSYHGSCQEFDER